MADKGRDVKISILSDLDQFDTSPAADDLDQLGDAAKDASTRLDASTDKMAKSVDQVGDKAHDTARKVDDAFDRIAKSSRSNLRKVDADTSRAKKGLDEFKDEATSTGRESAASFGGSFEDVADTIQETAANAFAGFGPIGAAAGLAAAAGIGFITNKLAEIKEKVNEVAESFRNLTPGAAELPTDRLTAFFDALDVDRVTRLRDGLKEAGIPVADFASAVANGGSELDTMQRRIQSAYDGAGLFKGALGGLVDETAYFVEGSKKGADAADIQAEALATAAARSDEFNDAMSGVTDQSGVMASAIEDSAQRTADSTSDAGDSWTDYRNTAVGSIDDVIAKQLEQLEAGANFQANTSAVYDRLGQDAVDWALAQGESADEAMALLAKAPLEKGRQVVANYRKQGQLSTAGYADGITDNKPRATAAADDIHDNMRSVLAKRIDVPVGVTGPTSGDLAGVRAGIRRGLSGITVTVDAIAQTISSRSVP